MNEVFFILFLLSGILKSFLIYFHVYTGIDFTLLIAIIMSLMIIKDIVQNSILIRLDTNSKYATLSLLALFTLILFSLFYTASQHYVYVKILQFFTILLGFLFPFLVKNFSVKFFFKWFIIITFWMTIVFLPLFIAGYKSFSTDYADYHDSPIAAIYQSYLSMGYVTAIAFLINSLAPIFGKYRRIFISLFFFGVMMATGARGPIFGVIIIGILFLLFRHNSFKRPKISTLFSTIIIISILTIFAATKFDIIPLLERTYSRITTIKKDPSANDRLVKARYVLNTIDVKHLAFGYGFGSFGYKYTRHDVRSYPHNMILEILFELGIAGVLIYAIFILSIVKQLIITKEFLPWALFMFLFLNSLKSLSLSDSRILFGFFAVILLYHTKQHISVKGIDQ